LYIQLEDKDVIDPVTGRVDKEKMGPEQILEVSGIHPLYNQQPSISPLDCSKIA
jgi:hypothetical protein